MLTPISKTLLEIPQVRVKRFRYLIVVHKAVEKNNTDFLQLLVEHHADTTIRNKKGRDASSYARTNDVRTLIRSAQLGIHFSIHF